MAAGSEDPAALSVALQTTPADCPALALLSAAQTAMGWHRMAQHLMGCDPGRKLLEVGDGTGLLWVCTYIAAQPSHGPSPTLGGNLGPSVISCQAIQLAPGVESSWCSGPMLHYSKPVLLNPQPLTRIRCHTAGAGDMAGLHPRLPDRRQCLGGRRPR